TFALHECQTCQLILTNPRPEAKELPRYYQSDDYISHSNTSRNVLSLVYRIARTFTLSWKYKLIQRHALEQPQTILDFGCGTGSFLAHCNKKGMDTTGVEPSSSARIIAAAA